MPINIVEATNRRAYAAHYTDRAWIVAELDALIARAAWEEIGGLAGYVALLAAPLARGLAVLVTEASALLPRTAAPVWSDPVWVTAELTAHATALRDPNSDLQSLALHLAGVCARISI